MYVKELLVEALRRAGHVKAGFPARATEIAVAEGYFNSALRKYSGNSIITAFQKVHTFTLENAETTIGKPSFKKGKVVSIAHNMREWPDADGLKENKNYLVFIPNTDVRGHFFKVANVDNVMTWVPCNAEEFCESWADEFCFDMSAIVKVMVKDKYGEWVPFEFSTLSEFYCDDRVGIYNADNAGENKVNIRFKECVVGSEIRIIYNASMKFASKDYIELPEDQVELVTMAVEHSILAEDDDSDPKKINSLEVEIQKLEDQLGAKNATTRRITRGSSRYTCARDRLIAGVFNFGG